MATGNRRAADHSGQPNAHDVVIVGGGPSAVAVLGALIRKGRPRSITILDPLPVGIGIVFGPRCAGDPSLLCNSSAGVTYIDEESPDEFVEFLIDRGWPVGRDDYTPRYMFGEFCRAKYWEHAATAQRLGVPLQIVTSRARSIRRSGDRYELPLENGTVVTGSEVVVCVGLEYPKIPFIAGGSADDDRLIIGAYPADVLRNVPDGSRVLILGLRSSAIDAAQVLCASGKTVVMTSPSGRLSAVRHRLSRPHDRVYLRRDDWLALDPAAPDVIQRAREMMLQAASDAGDGLAVDEQVSKETDGVRRLRDEIAIAEAGKTPWADLAYEAIGLMNEVFGPLDLELRQSLMVHAYGPMTRYINALPLLVARRLIDNFESGRAQLRSGVPALCRVEDGWCVTWPDGDVEHVDYVVAANGYDFPRFYLSDPDTIGFGHQGSVDGRQLVVMDDDLRMHFGPDQPAERIWAVGPSTNQRFPLAHIIFLGARHARSIAEQILGEGAKSGVDDVVETPTASGAMS